MTSEQTASQTITAEVTSWPGVTASRSSTRIRNGAPAPVSPRRLRAAWTGWTVIRSSPRAAPSRRCPSACSSGASLRQLVPSVALWLPDPVARR